MKIFKIVHLKRGLQRSRGIVRPLSVAVVTAIAVSLGSCTSNAPATNSASPQSATSRKQLQVVTTFIPITDFTKAVAGDRAQVTQLLPTNADPHDYQAKPEDDQKLAKADVLVQNGLGMEAFLENMVKNVGNANLKVIDSSLGVQTISTETIEGHDQRGRGAGSRGQGETKEAGEQGAGGRGTKGFAPAPFPLPPASFNPHIWLDPKRAIRQVENIRDGLIAADPGGKEIYSNNAAAYMQRLQELDAETTKMLQPFAGKTFVVFHDFAPYFAQSYNLKAIFLVDVPEDNPSPDDVKRIMEMVKATKLKTLLAEPEVGKGAFAAIAKDLNVRVTTFYSMETGGPEALQPEYYITTMRQNVKTLVTAFTGQSTQSFLPLWTPQPISVVPQKVGVKF